MSRSSFLLNDDLADYVRAHTDPVDDLVADLIAETATLPMAGMQVSVELSKFLTILTKVMRPQRVLEIGTFTGYSALSMARGLPPGGRIMACDVSGEWTAIARKYWARAGVADVIDLRLAPALETLEALPPGPQFDLVFIDADKTGYPSYFEATVDRVVSGGLILADNVLRHGRVVDADADSENVRAIRRFNDLVVSDERVEAVLLPAFDGLTMALRK
jgi:caffeoyl-CoA O-methyltransferase